MDEGETAADSGIASKTSSATSSALRAEHSPVHSSGEAREGSGDSLRRRAVGRTLLSVNTFNSKLHGQYFGTVLCVFSHHMRRGTKNPVINQVH